MDNRKICTFHSNTSKIQPIWIAPQKLAFQISWFRFPSEADAFGILHSVQFYFPMVIYQSVRKHLHFHEQKGY